MTKTRKQIREDREFNFKSGVRRAQKRNDNRRERSNVKQALKKYVQPIYFSDFIAYNDIMIDFIKTLIANVLFFVMIAVGYMAITYLIISSAYGVLMFAPKLLSMVF